MPDVVSGMFRTTWLKHAGQQNNTRSIRNTSARPATKLMITLTKNPLRFFQATPLFLLAALAGCDSNSSNGGAGAEATPSAQQIEDFDYDNLDQQVIESRDPGPSLGFALPPNGRIHAKSGAVGSTRGNEFERTCATGKVLVGISGNYSTRIERLQALCVTANNSGQWLDNPVSEQATAGTGNGQSFSQVCAPGHAIVGFTSDFTNDYPTYLQLHCGKLDGKRRTTGASVSLESLGTLASNAPSTRPRCAARAAATGFYGFANSAIERLGLICFEDPAFAGRWSSRVDWPHIAIHSVMLSDGKLLTYGTGGSGIQGAMEYNLWNPGLGIGQTSHKNIQGAAQVDSFCSAATMMSDTGDVLMSGGDARPLGKNNAGIRDAILFNASSESVSRANDMIYERWYPTSTTLPNGDILVAAGRDSNKVPTPIPEVYSQASGTWRALPNASMDAYNYFYPRQFVIPDGRVFGISGRPMWMMSTDGSGSITGVGNLPSYSFGASATAAMFEPGKILHAGGISNHGKGAIVIDVTSGSPEITRTEDLAEPRRAWASTALLADGNVLMLGGSYEMNDDVTASMGTEMWNPTTGKWTQYSRAELPRLYHSTALLLMDGRVLLAGGGSPGPLNNRNAEIFSPPYLFDENGSLAARPEISYAPEVGAWGQTISISTSNNANTQRVTLVKTGGITHGFNMDQRFVDLEFAVSANAVSVTMPASGNIAPPGFYMLFVHDANGTPSMAHMIKLGTEAAPSTPPPSTGPQLPPIADNTLLINGGFEQGKQAWNDCAAPSATSPASQSVEGNNSMQVSQGGCLYQEVNVQPGASYTLQCHARGSAVDYASMSLPMLDSNYQELDTVSATIDSSDYEQKTVTITAPNGAAFASATLYSEGATHFDRCELLLDSTPSQPPTPPVAGGDNLIMNGGFEQGKTAWHDCSIPGLSSVSNEASSGNNAMQITNAGCLYQEFALTPGTTYELSCTSKSTATNYSSLSLTLMNASYTTLASDHRAVGRNFFQVYKTSLFTPFEGRIGAVTLYSEDTAQFDDCAVVGL